MAFYMPKVYLEKKSESAETNALEVHRLFIENKSYVNLNSLVKEGMLSYFVPKGKNEIIFSGMHFNSKVTVKDKNLISFLRYMENDDFKNYDGDEFLAQLNPIKDELLKELDKFVYVNYSKKVEDISEDNILYKNFEDGVLIKFESSKDNTIATNLILVSKKPDGTYISAYPYIHNSITDIKSTVMSAFPVIFLLIAIIVFWLNKLYSKSITDPIIEMSKFTQRSEDEKNAQYDLEIHTNDEIEELSNNLKKLYETLTDNYKTLENNSKKREIFIKATSHELKTPLQTAMLLNESMINKIGKYKDTDKYLPELRDKLSKIQILIDDLLFMNKIDESPVYENLDLALIMEESIDNHMDLISDKNLNIKVTGEKIDYIDYDHFRIIFDNLIKNAIENTDKNGNIVCEFGDNIIIKNYPTHIDDKILKKISEPFVSSKGKSSSGLGLYVAKNLLEDMNYDIDLSYENETFILKLFKILQ